LIVSNKPKVSEETAELLKSIEQMKKGEKGRTYTEGQLLAISARKAVNLTQREFAKLLNVAIDTVQDWEQGRRSPRGAAKTLLKIAQSHPEVLEQLAS
jgi:putative transcriptional regulator